jgi:hypothetical protein
MLARIVGVSALVLAALLVAQHIATEDPSYADGPLPSVRAVLDCDGRVYQSRQEVRPGEVEKGLGQATPELALQTGLYSGDEWWISVDGFRVAHLKESREIFTFDVGGRSRFAALVEDSPAAGGWLLTSWAMCDPSELTGDDADRLGYGVWLDAEGDPVSTDAVMSLNGAEHCDWEKVTFLELNRMSQRGYRQYVQDPAGILASRLRTTYAAHAGLPGDARDTGWRRGGRALWLRPHGDAAYLVNLGDPSDVQRWPRARSQIACV